LEYCVVRFRHCGDTKRQKFVTSCAKRHGYVYPYSNTYEHGDIYAYTHSNGDANKYVHANASAKPDSNRDVDADRTTIPNRTTINPS
jgi:hypothetical protein